MKATKSELNKISKYLWKKGTGSKGKLAEAIGCKQSEISRLLKDGTISVEKLEAIKTIINEEK